MAYLDQLKNKKGKKTAIQKGSRGGIIMQDIRPPREQGSPSAVPPESEARFLGGPPGGKGPEITGPPSLEKVGSASVLPSFARMSDMDIPGSQKKKLEVDPVKGGVASVKPPKTRHFLLSRMWKKYRNPAEAAYFEPESNEPQAIKNAEDRAAVTDDLRVFTWEPESMRRRRLRLRIALWSAAILAVLGFLLPTFVFPSFTIDVSPRVGTVPVPATEFSAQTAATAPSVQGRVIPGLVISVDRSETKDFPASGTKIIRERARGTVEIFNAFSSLPQALVANTRFQDASGKIFRLTEGITIPGAKVQDGEIVPTSVTAKVAADGIGDAYNIGPSEFRIPGFRGTQKYEGFYARSADRFAGGFDGEAKIVLADDLRRASEELTASVIESLADELGRKLPASEDFVVPSGGRNAAVTSIRQPKAGDRQDRFTVTVTARGRLFVVRRSDTARVLAALLLPNEGVGLRLLSEQNGLSLSEARFQSPSELRFKSSGSLAYAREVNAEELVATLRTSTPRKAEAYLRGREEIDSFSIKRFPSWLWFIPSRPAGLAVNVLETD